jgi:glutathione S-transferase
MALTLVIGNKNYSSWSFRPWIALRVAGIPFEEVVIPLYEPGSKEQILQYSPAGKVPVLIDDDLRVWESLAIIDYLAERFPQASLWPGDAAARAHARAIAAEMHAGFAPLRRHCPMNMWRTVKARELTPEVAADVRRIEAIVTECRERFGQGGAQGGTQGGAFLFGAFGAADAMYAPVMARLNTYAIAVGAVAEAYKQAVMALPAWAEWRAAALEEPWIMANAEVDWPAVLRE